MKIELGPGTRCDVASLVDNRLLVQANSGGGKSWCLRRLLEQTHGHVQQLIIDPEGEFASLRERFDYIYAARQGGDTATDARSAKLLAERLLELGVSAILDIYELKAHERVRFVRVFLEALVDAPKKLWHPVLVVVDEAHVYCPQKGEAESASAVIDICTRGRKRGFCAVLATQRLSKLHKDAAAELNNKLIGRTGLDVDRNRAAEELGFTSRDESLQLRALEPGEFYAFGPAISAAVTKVAIGPVKTTHPKAGARLAFTAPPPTEKVRALLPKLADLPAEAEQKQRTEAELKKDLASARARITQLERGAVAVRVEPRVETKVERVMVPMLTEQHLNELRAAAQTVQQTFAGARGVAEQMVEARSKLSEALHRIDVAIAQATKPRPVQTSAPPRVPAAPYRTSVHQTAPRAEARSGELPKGERAVLRAVAHYPEGCSRKQLTVLTRYRRSTRDAYVQRLTERGYVTINGSYATATEAGLIVLGPDFEPLPIGSALLEHWRTRLPEGERKLLDLLVSAHPQAVEREVLSEATGYARSSRDAYLQRLGARRLVESEGRGAVRASDMLFDGAA